MNFNERYQYNPTSDLIGRGGFSRVFKAYDIVLHREVALKVYSTSASEKYDLVNEIRKVISFEHPNLCRYYDVAFLEGQTPLGEIEKYQVGIMEYLDSGDIRTYINKHPEHLKKLLKDVLEGLSYLHEHGIIHRDLKPQNILIKETAKGPVAKITDFGISKAVDNDHSASSSLLGTIEYMAPEQFNPAKYGIDGKISTNLDLWSFAMLVYELVSGKPMFGSRNSGTSAEQVMSNILGTIDPEIFDTLQEPYREVVRQGLIKDAKERISKAENVLALLETITPKQESEVIDLEETVVIPKIVQEAPVEEEVTQVIEKPIAKEEHETETRPKRKVLFIIGGVLIAGIALVIVINSRNRSHTIADSTSIQSPADSTIQKANTIPKVDTSVTQVKPQATKENELYRMKGDIVGDYIEGLAGTQRDDKFGFIDRSGKVVIPFIYDYVYSFDHGLAEVDLNGKVGYINKKGEIVIPIIYDPSPVYADRSEGLIRLRKDGKCGFLTLNGELALPFIYDFVVEDFSEGCAIVQMPNKDVYVIKKNGDKLSPALKYDLFGYEQCREGLIQCRLNGKYGFMDKTGKIVIPLIYNDIGSFENGKCKVYLDGKGFYIDRKGNCLKDCP